MLKGSTLKLGDGETARGVRLSWKPLGFNDNDGSSMPRCDVELPEPPAIKWCKARARGLPVDDPVIKLNRS